MGFLRRARERQQLERGRSTATRVLWALFLLSLPFSSHPWVARFTRGSPVSPLALLPAVGLVLIWLAPYFWRSGRLSALDRPLLVFLGVSLVGLGQAWFLPIHPFKGQELWASQVEAAVTLAVGLSFYWIASTVAYTEEDLSSSLRWAYIGGLLMLLWATIQGSLVIQGVDAVPPRIQSFHRLISIRDMFPNRVTGLAYEPSWFANQLVVFYIPLWLGSVLARFSVVRSRPRSLSVELALLLWAVVVFLLTISRVGLLSLFAMLGIVVLRATWRLASKVWSGRRVVMVALYFLLLCALAVTALAITYWLSTLDPRLARLFDAEAYRAALMGRYPLGFSLANRLAFAERVMYWTSAWRVFALYPVFGVGLGASGFFFRDVVPAFGYLLPEILIALKPTAGPLPNPKSLWFRLLAETGIVGFLAFTLWLALLGLAALRTYQTSATPLRRAIALAAGLALVAQVFEGFSLDTFALPHLWVILGLLSGTWQRQVEAGGQA